MDAETFPKIGDFFWYSIDNMGNFVGDNELNILRTW